MVWLICGLAGAQSLSHQGLFHAQAISISMSKSITYDLFLFYTLHPHHGSTNPKPEAFMGYVENALSYKISDNINCSLAYVYERLMPFTNLYRNEHRIHAQLMYNIHLTSRFTLYQRLRTDQRFIENRAADIYNFVWRGRYLAGLNIALNKTFYLNIYNEVFFTITHPRAAFYSENWALAAVGINTPHMGNIEAGPMYITWVNNDAGERTNLYYINITWLIKLPVNKKAKIQL
ncbi:MAG: DUF2490 domain-containing protein [Cytophagales bacterium]|nr:DUF2490 domain-containing protein [Cytophagales bacterium]